MTERWSALWSAKLDGLEAQCSALIRPRRSIGIAQWAAENRTLSEATAARPGPYDPSLTPWMAEIYECLHADHACDFVAVMKCQQSGLTELGLSWLAYTLAEDPGPWLVVQPTIADQRAFVSSRVADLRANTPAMPAASDTDNVSMTTFTGSVVRYGNAGSKGSLSSQPVRYVLLDEASKYPADTQGAGDPIALARGRTTTFKSSRKILIISTPELAGACHMQRAYLAGDRRVWRMPCPECGVMQELKLAGLTADGYQCEGCEVEINELRHKTWMLERGEWFPTNADGQYPSFHVSGFMRPQGWDGWKAIYDAWSVAAEGFARKTVMNLHLGLPYEEIEAHSMDEGGLLERCEVYPAEVPDGVVVLTAGVDVQGDRLELSIFGWGPGAESWLISRRVIPGGSRDVVAWSALESELTRAYFHESLGRIFVAAACVDSSFFTQDVYEWCLKNRHRQWYAIKGREGEGRHVWPPKANYRTHRSGAKVALYTVGVDTAKDAILSRLALTEPGPGYMHLPDWTPREWAEQMLAESRQVTHSRRGRPVVRFILRPGRRNEALDCAVYAYAALKALEASGLSAERALVAQADLRQGIAVAPGPVPKEVRKPQKFGTAQARAWGRA